MRIDSARAASCAARSSLACADDDDDDGGDGRSRGGDGRCAVSVFTGCATGDGFGVAIEPGSTGVSTGGVGMRVSMSVRPATS